MTKSIYREQPSGHHLVLLADRSRAIALASLHISESLLLELEATEILTAREIRGVLNDAATTLRNASGQLDNRSFLVASEIIESMRENFKRSKA